MSDEHPACPNKKAAGTATLPLFYRKKTSAGGRIEELSVGPCVVSLIRWVIILALALVLRELAPTTLLKLLVKLFP